MKFRLNRYWMKFMRYFSDIHLRDKWQCFFVMNNHNNFEHEEFVLVEFFNHIKEFFLDKSTHCKRFLYRTTNYWPFTGSNCQKRESTTTIRISVCLINKSFFSETFFFHSRRPENIRRHVTAVPTRTVQSTTNARTRPLKKATSVQRKSRPLNSNNNAPTSSN